MATVIYTNSMTPHYAVIWSGAFNFLGVLVSTGAVAFGIISLLPVELILQVGSSAGFAMVFALLIAAISLECRHLVFRHPEFDFARPGRVDHRRRPDETKILAANQSGTSGVDWNQALGVLKSLLFSPIAGFILAGGLLLVAKAVIRIPALYKVRPMGAAPPPPWMDLRPADPDLHRRQLLPPGSNDGQKGMGLIMRFILIGTVPTTLRPQPLAASSCRPGLRAGVRGRGQGHRRQGRRLQRAGQPAPRRVTLYVAQRTNVIAEGPFRRWRCW